MESYIRKENCFCSVCNKGMYRRPNQIEKGEVFCSSKCSNTRFKKDDILCVVCSSVIERRKRAKTCSRKCSNVHRTGTSYKLGRPKDNVVRARELKDHLLGIRDKKCNRCDFSVIEVIHVHHIIEKSKGGTDDIDNLELLCPNCHALHHHNQKLHGRTTVLANGTALKAV